MYEKWDGEFPDELPKGEGHGTAVEIPLYPGRLCHPVLPYIRLRALGIEEIYNDHIILVEMLWGK